jgi:DNA-binding NtrC family response regulator
VCDGATKEPSLHISAPNTYEGESMTVRKRILVVDDEAMVLFIFGDTLQALGEGYEIVTAQSGQEALDLAQKTPFDLVITDLSMPGIGGVQLTEAIKAKSPNTVVIWITAYGCHNVSAEADRLHVFRCRDKPLEVSEILQMAREALNNHYRPEAFFAF